MPTVQEALDRVWSDQGLKKRLLSDPKPVLKEFGLNIPDSVKVEIHENSASQVNYVLPVKPADTSSLPGSDPVVKVMERAWTDPGYKRKLLSNPEDAVAEMGVHLPASVKLKIWENTPTVEHMVLPMNPAAAAELNDAELESVAGGGLSKGVQTATGCGVAAGVAGGVGAALAFTIVGGIVGGVAAGAAGAGSAAGGAVASGGGKC